MVAKRKCVLEASWYRRLPTIPGRQSPGTYWQNPAPLHL